MDARINERMINRSTKQQRTKHMNGGNTVSTRTLQIHLPLS